MSKFLTGTRFCNSCIITHRQLLLYNHRNLNILTKNVDHSEKQSVSLKTSNIKANFQGNELNDKKIHSRLKKKQIADVINILQKYEIDTRNLQNYNTLYSESPWAIETKIMLLQELGVSKIELHQIALFYKRLDLSVKMIKADCGINPDVNLAKNLLSVFENSSYNYKSTLELSDEMPLKQYYNACLICYVKQRLNINERKLTPLLNKRRSLIVYNSFKLLDKMLDFLINDLNYNTNFILNYRYLFGLHPDHAETNRWMLQNEFGVFADKIIMKNPKSLAYDVYELEILLLYLKQLNVEPKNVYVNCSIFNVSSAEIKRRIDSLLRNPFTLVYKNHPRFLSLVYNYYIILARIRYLEEKNLKFATVHTLTTFHNYLELLSSSKKLTLPTMKIFLKSYFRDEASKLVQVIQKHPYWSCVPLVQVHETLQYLREHYSQEVIIKNFYAILYNRSDLEAARNVILRDPQYSGWTADKILALCVYKIEETCNFTGKAVFCPEKYSKTCNESPDAEDELLDEPSESSTSVFKKSIDVISDYTSRSMKKLKEWTTHQLSRD